MKRHVKSNLISQAFTKYEDRIFQIYLLSEYVGIYKNKVLKGLGMAHIIKKDRLSTRFFAATFRMVAAVRFGNMAPCSLLVVPPSPCLRYMKIT